MAMQQGQSNHQDQSHNESYSKQADVGLKNSGPTPANDADGKIFFPYGRWTVGRSQSCDVVIRDPSVSRKHAFLFRSLGGLRVEDRQSRNGVLVNRVKTQAARLNCGDVVAFGAVEFKVVSESTLKLCEPLNSEISTKQQPALSPPIHLTPARKRVLELILEGLSEREIASRLDVSPATVHTQITDLYRLCGVHSRAEMMAFWLRKER